MKQYKVSGLQLRAIKALFRGYIFNRVDNDGQSWIMCSNSSMRIINKALNIFPVPD